MEPITGAIIGGIANSLFAPKPKYVVPNYKGIRNAAEKAGFNPLTALTQGPQGSVVQGENYMGSAISDALLIAAGDKEKDARISLLEAQTEHYRKAVENMTLRPKIGGVYEKRDAEQSAEAANMRPLAETSVVDPRREVDNAKIKSHSGFITLDNPYLPFPLYFPTLDGDEASSFAAPFAVLGSAGYAAGNAYEKSWSSSPAFSMGGKNYQQMPNKTQRYLRSVTENLFGLGMRRAAFGLMK